jgi:RecG-like helicase
VTGTAQSGYLTLSIADLSRDKETLMTARADAFNTLRTERQKAN